MGFWNIEQYYIAYHEFLEILKSYYDLFLIQFIKIHFMYSENIHNYA